MYSETFLADLKSRVAISEVIGRSVKLRRDGKEFRAVDNASLTVNDAKALWFDHATNEGGDALAWLQKSQGLSFGDAVADLASIAGVALPNGDGQARQPQPKKQQKAQPTAKREIVYDYTDAQAELIYQVVRLEWIEDGARCKTFRQRRPDPDKPGEWLWNLEGVKHGLYRLPELREAGADEIVFLPEGEKDVETLIGFGLTATTNSGGAKNWRQDHAELLRGRDVVVLVDNDDPGRERGKTIAASLHGIARRVRVLDFSHPDIWPDMPKGKDVTDWVKTREGDAQELAEIVESLPDAKPAAIAAPADGGPDDWQGPTEIPEGAGTDSDREPPLDGEQKQKPLIISSADFVSGFIPPDYLVDGLLQKRFCYSLTGPTGSGKSAIALLFSAHVALDRPIGDRGVEAGRVLYLAGENPDDIRMRWIAMADQMEFDVNAIGVHFLPGVFKISEIAGRIKKEVERIGTVALVVVDTSAAYFEGDEENNNVQQGVHARRLRTLTTLPGGPAVLIACHPVKNATLDNLIPKGGGNFINEVDGNLTAWKTDSVTAIHWQGKFRGAEFAPLMFQLHTATTKRLTDSQGRLIPTVVAVSMSENEQVRIETKSRSDEDQLLVSILENERTSLKAHAVILGWKTKSGEPNKTLVNRVASNLKKGKLVTMERRGLALTPKGTKEAELVKSNLARAGELISRDKL